MDKERILTTEAQAKAVQEVGFLGQFFQPTSPSDAAKKLGQPANLVHHHVQKHLELGLLEEVGRENGKVLYQLSAQHFKVPMNLLPPSNPDNKTAKTLGLIQKRFLEAYERSDRLASDQDPEYDHYGFSLKDEPDPWRAPPGDMLEPHAAQFQTRTVILTPKSYQRLVQHISALLENTEKEPSRDATACTFVFLGMEGELQVGTENSQGISSFVPPIKESV